MIELVCIACPNSCLMQVERLGDKINATGNKCPRGLDFARNEIISPKRSVSTTVRTAFEDMPVVPVRTNGEIPKEKLLDLMRYLKTIKIVARLARGQVVVENYDSTGIDIIITTDMR